MPIALFACFGLKNFFHLEGNDILGPYLGPGFYKLAEKGYWLIVHLVSKRKKTSFRIILAADFLLSFEVEFRRLDCWLLTVWLVGYEDAVGADPSNPPIPVAGPDVAEIFVVVAGHEAALLEPDSAQLSWAFLSWRPSGPWTKTISAQLSLLCSNKIHCIVYQDFGPISGVCGRDRKGKCLKRTQTTTKISVPRGSEVLVRGALFCSNGVWCLPKSRCFQLQANPGIGEISGLELSTAHRHTIVFASFSGRPTVARIMASISPACYLREQQPDN